MKYLDPVFLLKYRPSSETIIRVLKWFGVGLLALSSISMALFGHSHINLQLYIYMGYILGALCMLAVGVLSKDKAETILYCVFAAVDATGIILRLL